MSRQLPERPSLEYLKKQAKDLLQELQQSDREAVLADAQHALARLYGFKSWPKLKLHVESLRSPFDGRWAARDATIDFAVRGDQISIRHVTPDDSGTNVIHADGEARPGHAEGYVFIARWAGVRVLEVLEKTREGDIVGRGTYEVSADGKSMVISSNEQVIVLNHVG